MFDIHHVKQDVRQGFFRPAGPNEPLSDLSETVTSHVLPLRLIRHDSFDSHRILTVTCVLLAFAFSTNLFGQGFFNNTGAMLPDPQLIEPPREMIRLLEEAREHVENKVWSEATLAAGIGRR
jgi:hypothetical protein